MAEPKRIPALVRLGGELVVIVLGVLIALWAEGWREGRAEAQRTHEHLARLSVEVQEQRVAIDSAFALDSLHLHYTQTLLETLISDEEWTQPDSMRAMIRYRMSRFVPSLPTLQVLLRSEEARPTISPELRASLVQLESVSRQSERWLVQSAESAWDRIDLLMAESWRLFKLSRDGLSPPEGPTALYEGGPKTVPSCHYYVR